MWSHLYELLRAVRLPQTESRMLAARGWGVSLCNGRSFSFAEKKVLEVSAQQCDRAGYYCPAHFEMAKTVYFNLGVFSLN